MSAQHDHNAYLGLLRPRGAMVLVGAPSGATPLHLSARIAGGKRPADAMIGGIAETQERLDHCARHGIASDKEIIQIQQINAACERILRSDVRSRFVFDMASLEA